MVVRVVVVVVGGGGGEGHDRPCMFHLGKE